MIQFRPLPIRYDPKQKKGLRHHAGVVVEGLFPTATEARKFSTTVQGWWRNLDELVERSIACAIVLDETGDTPAAHELAQRLKETLLHYQPEDLGDPTAPDGPDGEQVAAEGA